MQSETPEMVLSRAARRNFFANLIDVSFFAFGINMVSRYTVLPYFVGSINNNPLLLSLIPMLTQVGWLLPQLFTAPYIKTLPRRKPYVLLMTAIERIPFLVFGLLLLFGKDLPGSLMLSAFFIGYAIHTFFAGFTATAWQDMIARVIPGKRWGIFFGLSSAIGAVLGIFSAKVTDFVLESMSFPNNVGLLSLLCFVGLTISFSGLAATVEPAQPTQPREPMMPYLRSLPPLLKKDKGFRNYLITRTALSLSFLGHSFVTAGSMLRFDISLWLGTYLAAQLASQALSDVVMGTLADRWGHKQVLKLANLIGVLALVASVLAPSPEWLIGAYVLIGIATSGYQLSGYTLVMTFSTDDQRPTYIGLANTALAPVGFFGPLLLGALASRGGYNMLFLFSAVIGAIALALLQWWVPDVRRQEQATEQASQSASA
jgi:MFS family permease